MGLDPPALRGLCAHLVFGLQAGRGAKAAFGLALFPLSAASFGGAGPGHWEKHECEALLLISTNRSPSREQKNQQAAEPQLRPGVRGWGGGHTSAGGE